MVHIIRYIRIGYKFSEMRQTGCLEINSNTVYRFTDSSYCMPPGIGHQTHCFSITSMMAPTKSFLFLEYWQNKANLHVEPPWEFEDGRNDC